MVNNQLRTLCILSAMLGLPRAVAAQTFQVSTAHGNGADIELTENNGPFPNAVDGGNGTKVNANARWNFGTEAMDRNEWVAVRFDLSDFEDKSVLTDVSLNFTMYRSNSNNNKLLQLYALAPGTPGEDWDEATTTYGSMPGFTFDQDSSTNLLDVGGVLVDLGTFQVTVPMPEVEGEVASINPPSLTSLIQGMGSNNLVTILITTGASTNGQWRVFTKEGFVSDTALVSGEPGDFAPFLEFSESTGGLPGDFNGNGSVENADLTLLLNNWGAAVPPTPDGWIGQPLTAPAVDNDELTALLNNWGATSGAGQATTVPEPAAAALAAIAVLAAAATGRRRQSRPMGFVTVGPCGTLGTVPT